MKKIIAAFDSISFSESTMHYAIYAAKEMQAHLVGVFLDDPMRKSFSVYDAVTEEEMTGVTVRMLERKDKKTRSLSAQRFEDACNNRNVKYSIHHDEDIAIKDLLRETIFADLLIINMHESLSRYKGNFPSRFIKELLQYTHCPVLLVPETFHPIESVAVLYDGTPTSVYAAKMFSYLLPELDALPTEIVHFKKSEKTREIPEKEIMKEWVQWHFSSIGYKMLEGDAEQLLTEQLKHKRKNQLVVAGAYNRGTISMWMRPSFIDQLLKETTSPLFIAHT